jgi:hypothetical protein
MGLRIWRQQLPNALVQAEAEMQHELKRLQADRSSFMSLQEQLTALSGVIKKSVCMIGCAVPERSCCE